MPKSATIRQRFHHIRYTCPDDLVSALASVTSWKKLLLTVCRIRKKNILFIETNGEAFIEPISTDRICLIYERYKAIFATVYLRKFYRHTNRCAVFFNHYKTADVLSGNSTPSITNLTIKHTANYHTINTFLQITR